VAQHGCAIFIGPTSTGKSHLLNAWGYTACEKGISVRFTRVVDMINLLTTAQINGTLDKALRQYTLPQALLLDEMGYLPIDKRGADLLLQVVAARYECGSIVISTNRVFRDWGAIFDVDNTLATAMIDRLMHHGEAIVIRRDSYRMKPSNPSHATSACVVAPVWGLVGAASDGLGAQPALRYLRNCRSFAATVHPSPLVLKRACTESPRLPATTGPRPCPESRRASQPWCQGTAAAQVSAS
jgi:hypothetical protein